MEPSKEEIIRLLKRKPFSEVERLASIRGKWMEIILKETHWTNDEVIDAVRNRWRDKPEALACTLLVYERKGLKLKKPEAK